MSNSSISQPRLPAKVTRRQLLASLSTLALLSAFADIPAAAAETIDNNVHICFTRDSVGRVHFTHGEAGNVDIVHSSTTIESWLSQLHHLTATLIEFGGLLTSYRRQDPEYQPDDIDLLTLAYQVRDELNELDHRLICLEFDELIRACTGRRPWAVHIEHAIRNGDRSQAIRDEIHYLGAEGETVEAEKLLRLLEGGV